MRGLLGHLRLQRHDGRIHCDRGPARIAPTRLSDAPVETWDKPGHQHLRRELRPAHLRFLQEHAARLLACGAKLEDGGTDVGGGVYIVDVDSREEAERFIQSDPFHAGGLFREVRLTRWRKAYLGGQSFLPPSA